MKAIVISLALVFVSLTSQSQPENSTPSYWVVESNVYFRDCSIVKFYNDQDQLVHEVKIMGVFIDITKPKDKKKLDELLRNFRERIMATTNKEQQKSELVSIASLTF